MGWISIAIDEKHSDVCRNSPFPDLFLFARNWKKKKNLVCLECMIALEFFLDEILLKKATDVGSNDFTFQKKKCHWKLDGRSHAIYLALLWIVSQELICFLHHKSDLLSLLTCMQSCSSWRFVVLSLVVSLRFMCLHSK